MPRLNVYRRSRSLVPTHAEILVQRPWCFGYGPAICGHLADFSRREIGYAISRAVSLPVIPLTRCQRAPCTGSIGGRRSSPAGPAAAFFPFAGILPHACAASA